MDITFKLEIEVSKHDVGSPLEKLLNEAIEEIQDLRDSLEEANEKHDDFDDSMDCDERAFYDADLNQIEKLSVCGQKEPARALALQIVGEAIGRAI